MGLRSARSARRRFGVAVVVAAGAAGGVLAQVPGATAAPEEARRFIVTLRDSVADPAAVAAEHAARHGAEVAFVYRHALKGYAGTFRAGAISEVASDGRVAAVEPDGEMHAVTTQSGATWGLDRIDQRALPLNATFNYTNTGAGVTAYIIDTGITFAHTEFGGRAVFGHDAVPVPAPGGDCNGHGTHVAGTVGGATYGVAKAVGLVSVRVLDCTGSGSTSGVIAGVDWVTGDHDAGEAAVANMSLGGGASSALDTAVKSSIADGVSYAVAAGNGNIVGIAQDACRYSPARVAEAMTIGASDKSDKKTTWSNHGNCVDWFAPGAGITSAWWDPLNPSATNTISGTSMATPHTAGVAALHLQANPSASPATVRKALYDTTTKGTVTSSRTANNHLLFTNY